MNKNTYIIIILILVIAVGGVTWYLSSGDYKIELEELSKKNDSISKIKDIQIKSRDSIILRQYNINDTLMNKSTEVKYIRYEKTTYVDRDLNTALDVFSEHPINREAED